jgi:DNA modification methylase
MAVIFSGSSLNPDSLRVQLTERSSNRRRASKAATDRAAASPRARNDLQPKILLVERPIKDLTLSKQQVRLVREEDIEEAKNAIIQNGCCVPIILGRNDRVLDGHLRIKAAQRLGFKTILCNQVTHLTDVEEDALSLSANHIGRSRPFDLEQLKIVLNKIETSGETILHLGFSRAELDELLLPKPVTESMVFEPQGKVAVTTAGNLWFLGSHRLLCGDSTKKESFETLLEKDIPQLCIADFPYNLVIKNLISTRHREFAQGSGEMSPEQFKTFLQQVLDHCRAYLAQGGIALGFMDWRHVAALIEAGTAAGFELLNLICWVKAGAGMGSLWRSNHELIAALKKPGKHKNNIELGRNGRDRSNVWYAAGAGSPGSDARKMLADHPTPKPVDLLVDAMKDISDRDDIVLDPFGGSGSTLIAAQQTGRAARLIEIDPLYCDVTIRRWQKLTGEHAVLAETGDRFAAQEETCRVEETGQ